MDTKQGTKGEITQLILYHLPYSCDTQLAYKIPQSEYLHHNQGKDTKHLHSAEHIPQFQISCISHTKKEINMLSCKNILKSEFFVIPLIRFLVASFHLSPPWSLVLCPFHGCGAGID
jgi:hypothetical protein